MLRLGLTRLGAIEEGGAGAAAETPPTPPPEANTALYDALDFNVRPAYDTWTDLCTVHLKPGTWLVGGEALMEAKDDTQTWAALYVHETDEWFCLTYCHCDSQGESSGYRTVYVQDIIEILAETDVSLRWRSRGTILAVPQFVTVAAKNDERTIDGGPYWFTTVAGVDLTHMTAVPIDGVDYKRAVVEGDTLLATRNYNYAVMSLDLDPGTWIVLANFATTELGPQVSGALADHAAGSISVDNEAFRYVDDGERGGGHGYNPIFNLHGIVDTEVDGSHVEALAACVTADCDSFYVKEDWGILDHFGSPVTSNPAPGSYNTGSLLAIRVPNSEDAVSSYPSASAAPVVMAFDRWTDGVEVNIGEGTWLMWGAAHLLINGSTQGFTWGCEIAVSGDEYAIAAREGWGDPANEALVSNSVMQMVTVPGGGFATAKLRGYCTGMPPGPGSPGTPGTPGGPGYSYPTIIYTIICPEIAWVNGPGEPGAPPTPGHPGQPTNQAHATVITAIRLPFGLSSSFTPLHHVRKFLPTARPAVELYRLSV